MQKSFQTKGIIKVSWRQLDDKKISFDSHIILYNIISCRYKAYTRRTKLSKRKNKVSVNYAAERACKFAISSLSQEAEGKNTGRAAVPGDGFKY